jgi:hypothetical protein
MWAGECAPDPRWGRRSTRARSQWRHRLQRRRSDRRRGHARGEFWRRGRDRRSGSARNVKRLLHAGPADQRRHLSGSSARRPGVRSERRRFHLVLRAELLGGRRLLQLRLRKLERDVLPHLRFVRERAARRRVRHARNVRRRQRLPRFVAAHLPKLPADPRRPWFAGLCTLDMHARTMRGCLLRGGAYLPRRAWLPFVLSAARRSQLRDCGRLYARRSHANLLLGVEGGGAGRAGGALQ